MAAEAAVQAIHEAVGEGNAETVARMLDEDPRLLSSTKDGDGLLMRAAWKGRVGTVKLLLERGQDVNTLTSYGTTALLRAAFYGHGEVVSLLLTSGADVNRRSASGDTALMYASLSGRVAVVRLLLRSMGGRGLSWGNRLGSTALYLACFNGNADVVRALLLAGADHTIAGNNGQTGQQIAQNRGHPGCAALIQWWENELQRAYVLHKARTLHDNTTTHQQAPAAPMPAYLRTRVQEDKPMPRVQVQGRGSGGPSTRGAAKRGAEEGGHEKEEEEVCGMVHFVVKDLAAELYTELLAGLHQ